MGSTASSHREQQWGPWEDFEVSACNLQQRTIHFLENRSSCATGPGRDRGLHREMPRGHASWTAHHERGLSDPAGHKVGTSWVEHEYDLRTLQAARTEEDPTSPPLLRQHPQLLQMATWGFCATRQRGQTLRMVWVSMWPRTALDPATWKGWKRAVFQTWICLSCPRAVFPRANEVSGPPARASTKQDIRPSHHGSHW